MCIRYSPGILWACSDVAARTRTTKNMTPLTIFKYKTASRLDALAVLIAKVLPIADAGVFYNPNRSWRLDAWKQGRSCLLEVGGWTFDVDLR
ncbi:hypothetical protein GCM10027399_09070 [Curvibacter fontanus]